ncbi:MAG: protein kinase [Fuerstiella sp.]|jgi:serine/threonine protein kinase|nr:protein kinase [Fuerstiella sp.]
MSPTPLSAFELLEKLPHGGCEGMDVWRAQSTALQSDLRLTLFSVDTSGITGFRAAFRKDQMTLSEASHDNVPEMLYWGEDEGRLFFVTDMPQGIPLYERFDAGEGLSWDELADIGWQIASALQHVHNRGVSHGALTASSVFVSTDVRVSVADFGVHRWLGVDDSSGSFADFAAQDLRDFGKLLTVDANGTLCSDGTAVTTGQVHAMDTLIADLSTADASVTARDVQGRLGRMLLDVAGDSIELVDERNGQHLARRSIVDELFDDESTTSRETSVLRSAVHLPSMWLKVLIAVIVIAVVTAMVVLRGL